MRWVNVHLEDELDQALAAEAARTGESKSLLLRQAAQALLDQRAAVRETGAWGAFTGAVTNAGPDDRHHDDVIYGS